MPTYQRPSLSDFSTSFTCPHCSKFNETQDIRSTKEGKIYRICANCAKTMDLHIPPTTTVVKWKNVSKCYSNGCNCTDYREVKDAIISFTCECGHLGSYHSSENVPVETKLLNAKTWKSELIPNQYDASTHDDLKESCVIQ